jgi:hypothetical protein
MVTLYKRATPSQARILRAVEGAVKNAADAHPEMKFDRRFARSVAKRAAGTLTAQWPDVLAAREVPSETPDPGAVRTARRSWPVSPGCNAGRRGARLPTAGAPLRRLWAQIAVKMRDVKRDTPELAPAYIDVLKMIDKLRRCRLEEGAMRLTETRHG